MKVGRKRITQDGVDDFKAELTAEKIQSIIEDAENWSVAKLRLEIKRNFCKKNGVKIFLANGFKYEGFILADDNGFLLLKDSFNKEIRISKAQITVIEPLGVPR